MTITREEILDLLPIYALGTLGPEETAAIDEFLSEHHDLLESIYAATDSVELLALAAPSVRPPAYVKRELMRRIATVADVLPLQARSAPVSPVVRTPKEQEGWRWPTIVRNVLAVSAATTLIALASYSALLSQQVTTMTAQTLEQRERIASLETETSALAGAIDKLKTTIDALEVERTDLVAKNRQLASTNAQLDVRIQEINQELTTDQDRLRLVSAASDAVMLFGGVTAPQSRGAFYLSGSYGLLVVHGLKPLPESQIYQLWWVIEDGTQLPIAPVAVEDGVEPTWAVFNVPQQTEPYSVVGLSIEPASGVQQPTGPMILEGVRIG